MKPLARMLSALIVMLLAIPAVAQVTDEDIDRVRAETNAILADSEQLGREVQEAWARQFSLENEISDLEASIEFAYAEIAEAETKLEEVAVELYMGATSSASIQVLFSASRGEYEAGLEYLEEISSEETNVINQLRSFRAELDRQTIRLAEASTEEGVLAADLEAMAAELGLRLAAAQEVYDQLVEQQRIEEEERLAAEEAARRAAEEAAEEAARQAAEEAARQAAEEAARQATTTTTSTTTTTTTTTLSTITTTTTPLPPPSAGAGACPVAGAVSFTDTWGSPRSSGRTHKGVDLIAAHNVPLVAIYSGTIKRITTGTLSGLSVWLTAENGDEFFYAHLESYGNISVGQAVPKGYTIGYVGTSGNAPDWLPHVHFEWHPGGGQAVNPYPLVKSICG